MIPLSLISRIQERGLVIIDLEGWDFRIIELLCLSNKQTNQINQGPRVMNNKAPDHLSIKFAVIPSFLSPYPRYLENCIIFLPLSCPLCAVMFLTTI